MKASVIKTKEALEYIKNHKVRLVTKINHEKNGQVDIKLRVYDSELDKGEDVKPGKTPAPDLTKTY